MKPICDNAETLAGAGTDVRRCSDALGPRKNLHLLWHILTVVRVLNSDGATLAHLQTTQHHLNPSLCILSSLFRLLPELQPVPNQRMQRKARKIAFVLADLWQ